MNAARRQSSEIGLAYALSKKETGVTLEQAYVKYSNKLFQQDFRLLDADKKNEVLKEIIKASGRSSRYDNRVAAALGSIGRTLMVATVLISGYNIVNAHNKIKQAAKEGSVLISASAGSMGGGAIAGLVCGPGALICSTVGVFLGAIGFGIGSGVMFDKIFVFWN